MRMRIRELRTSQKMTIDQLADRAKISRGFISQIETGKRDPSVETLRSIADALGVPASELLGGEALSDLDDDDGAAEFIAKFSKLDKEDRATVEALMDHLSRKKSGATE